MAWKKDPFIAENTVLNGLEEVHLMQENTGRNALEKMDQMMPEMHYENGF